MEVKPFGFMPLALVVSSAGPSGGRSIPARPCARSLKIHFNAEDLHACFLLIDARSAGEKASDSSAGKLKGPAIVFFQGHAQRPTDAYAFNSGLALRSLSGVVAVPVCDTPYGADESWRGDRGKEAILMEIVRWALVSSGIKVTGYSPVAEEPVRINGRAADDGHCLIHAELAAVGWSHGGILARRMAHAHPGAFVALGQVCPAGYERVTPLSLAGRFALESLRISKLTATGHAHDALSSAWGFTKGFTGDFARSVCSAFAVARPEKVTRTWKDISDCCLYCDSSTLSLSHLKRISVIFGADDTCMNPHRILGAQDAGVLSQETIESFRKKYYDDIPSGETCLGLDVLPGTHLAPVSHSDMYVGTLLKRLEL